jgi:hypothetical protein
MDPRFFCPPRGAGALALLAGALLAAAPAGAQSAASAAPAGSWQTLEPANPPLKRHENAFAEAGGRLYLLGGGGSGRWRCSTPAPGGGAGG